ncbi:hypothetical protein BDB01DRAFT_835886 [Pilobolus umbonatus]|nr:hypothetical protein BDB01DRAFT_835886 [Pilobolus umbonatus]
MTHRSSSIMALGAMCFTLIVIAIKDITDYADQYGRFKLHEKGLREMINLCITGDADYIHGRAGNRGHMHKSIVDYSNKYNLYSRHGLLDHREVPNSRRANLILLKS